MSKLVVGIIDPFHPAILRCIEEAIPADWRLSVAREATSPSRSAALAEADVAYVMATPMPADVLRRAPRLRFIQKLGAGVDRIDLEACKERGIAVARLQAGNSIPVAEHTILLMLAACRRLPQLDRQTREGRWDKEAARGVSRQIGGSTVGIVGFGAIGQAVASLLRGFGAKVIYFDPRRAPDSVEKGLNVEYAALDDLVSRADIVSLHLPLIAETRGLFDSARLRRMKPGSILVNCARGGLVDEAALHDALVSDHLHGAGIDTFQNEPPVGSPLLTLDQTVVTPHTAGGTIDNFAPVIARAVKNTESFLQRKPIPADDVVLAPSGDSMAD